MDFYDFRVFSVNLPDAQLAAAKKVQKRCLGKIQMVHPHQQYWDPTNDMASLCCSWKKENCGKAGWAQSVTRKVWARLGLYGLLTMAGGTWKMMISKGTSSSRGSCSDIAWVFRSLICLGSIKTNKYSIVLSFKHVSKIMALFPVILGNFWCQLKVGPWFDAGTWLVGGFNPSEKY